MTTHEDLDQQIRELDRRITHLEASMGHRVEDVEQDIAELKVYLQAEVDKILARIDAQDAKAAEFWQEVIPKLVEQSAKLDALTEKLADKLAESPPPRPPIWESEDGRRVIWWICVALVGASLALAGGLTAQDFRAWAAGGVTAPPAESTATEGF